MPVHKSQLFRLKRISALLKENRYPNTRTLVEEFRRMDIEENICIACCAKTVRRDIALLKDQFNCPLAFDRQQNGYFLKHHGWDFISPALLDEREMLAAVIGARISEAVFPAPLKNQIRAAVDFLLQNNNPDFLDTANMQSLSVLSGLYVDLDPEIFMTVFKGWEQHRCVRIEYADYTGKVSSRAFEPHTLVFYENSWYSKGWCHLKKAPRTFALRRIKSAELLRSDFEPDPEIIESVNMDDFLGFQKLSGVKLRVSEHTLEKLSASPLHSGQIVEGNIVTVPAVSKEILFPFLLGQAGGAELLAPQELREEFKNELKIMLEQYF